MMIYVFVEGMDDEMFVNEVLKEKKNEIKIIQYSNKKKEKINSMIKSFKSMNEKYVLLADLDEKDKTQRIKDLKKKYADLEIEKIYFSIQEIEAWYISGVSKESITKYKIKENKISDTQWVTKEKFEAMFAKCRENTLQVKLNILDKYDVEKAKSRNKSLKIFLEDAV